MSARRVMVSAVLLCVVGAVMAGEKIDICHSPPGNPENFHTITISVNALDAHLAHGDGPVACNEYCAYLCDDGDACTVDDLGNCEEEGCPIDREPVSCDDGDPCTEDLCDSATGCYYEPICPSVSPGYSGLTEAAGVRYRGNSSGNEIYLGIPDLGVGGNRVETSYPNVYANWQDGTYAITFSFVADENKIVTTIDDGNGDSKSLEYDFDDFLAPGCPVTAWNTMDINVVDRLTTGELAFNNAFLNEFPLGNFDDEGWKNWTVSGFDFSQSFTVSGDMVVQGWTGSETNKLQIVVGCLP